MTVYTKNDLPQQWAETSGNLAETLFLSGQFVKVKELLGMLFEYADLMPTQRVPLLAISIANSICLGAHEQVYGDFESISRILFQQDSDFTLNWDFSSVEIAIAKNQVFSFHRQWLLDLIDALANGRRDMMQGALQTARATYVKFVNP